MAKVVFKFGDDISTDAIYPGRYMATVLPTETPQFCFADYAELNKNLNSGEWKNSVPALETSSVRTACQRNACGCREEGSDADNPSR